MYLRGKFKNILKHRGFPQLLSSWPTDNDIQMFISSADGLFAHSAAVLRHMVYPPDSQFRERLQSVLDSLSCRKTGVPITLFATRCSLSLHYEGDSREHSPVFKFSSVLSFLLEFWHSFVHFHGSLHAYNMFKDICHHLHAVISYEASYGPLGSIDPRIDLTRLCSDQGQWFHSNRVIMVHRISITNPSTISSAIPLALVSSVSTLLPLIPRSYDSRSPSLCTKLCYWPFKHVFHTW